MIISANNDGNNVTERQKPPIFQAVKPQTVDT